MRFQNKKSCKRIVQCVRRSCSCIPNTLGTKKSSASFEAACTNQTRSSAMKNAKTNWLQRNRFLVGIISCYLIAFLFPSFGIKIYSFSPLDEELWGQKQTIRLILAITVLLSSIAVGVNSRSGQSMSSIRIGLRVGIIKVALSSLFLVFAVLAQMVPGESFQGLVLGMATILAMPTAISTIAWCTKKIGRWRDDARNHCLFDTCNSGRCCWHFVGSQTDGRRMRADRF